MKSIRDSSDFSKHAKARRPGSTEWGRDVGHRAIALERETRGAGSYQERQKLSVKQKAVEMHMDAVSLPRVERDPSYS